LATAQSDYCRAEELHEQALALHRDLGDRWGVANTLLSLANVAAVKADYAKAALLSEEALERWREVGDTGPIAQALHNFALTLYWMGQFERAAALQTESLALRRQMGEKRGTADSLLVLSGLACRQGDLGRAATMAREALELSRDSGAQDLLGEALERIAQVTTAHHQPQVAACLAGAAEALREVLHKPLFPGDRADHEALVHSMHVALGDDAFAAAWTEGRAMSLDDAVQLALEVPPR
jgi:tetratricopeptide (TPR) repeat protein